MPEADAGLDHVADSVHRMATDMAKSEKSAEGLGSAFRQAALTVVGFEQIAGLAKSLVQRTQTFQALQHAVSMENLTRMGLLRREIDLDNEKLNLQRVLASATGRDLTYHQMKMEAVEGELRVLEKQKIFAAELERIGRGQLVLFGLYKAAAVDVFLKERELNQNLIEANSSYRVRGALLRETLMTQAQLGISFGQITSAAKALVHYNLDTEKTFQTNVRLVAQMEQGLAVSVHDSARLASIVERQVGGAFEHVANVVAQLVDDTALAGEEATRLAQSIASAMGRLRPGMGAQGLPDVVRLVGRYESALKEVGGASGGFQQLINSLTTPEGITGAGALGINPEFLTTAQGVQGVMDRFVKYGESLVGQSEGWARQMRLQALADMFHLSSEQANQMLIAARRASLQQVDQISLQDRWRNQLHATNSGIARLGNSLLSLLNGAMYPLTFAVGAVANKLADLIEWTLQYRTTVYVAMTGLGIGFLAVTSRMIQLGRSLWGVVASSQAAAASLARLSTALAATTVTGAAGAGTGVIAGFFYKYFPTFTAGFASIGSALKMVWTGLRAGFGLIASPLGIIITILAGISYLAAKWRSDRLRLDAESRNLEQIRISQQKSLEEKHFNRAYVEANKLGSVDEVVKQYRLLARGIKVSATTPEELSNRLAEAAERMLDTVDTAVTTRVAFTPLKERTPVEARQEDALLNLTGKLVGINGDMKDEYRKQTRIEEEAQKQNEIDVMKNRLQNKDYGPLDRTKSFMYGRY